MKRFLIIAFLFFLVLTMASAVNADEILGHRVFAMDGELIEYVPFSFTVPWGNYCDNVRTYEYIPSYGGYNSQPAHWKELLPGEMVGWGIYKFVADGNICKPEAVVYGIVDDNLVYGVWSGREVEPEDLGVLAKGVGTATNYFNLPTDDSQFSYILVYPPFGRKYALDGLIADAGSGNFGIQPAGSDLVGAIISDNRGFLKQLLFSPSNLDKSVKMLNKYAKNIILYDDQVVVLIYKENY